MLMVVKNQLKVISLSFKYSLMKEMLNRTSFVTNVLFMVLNNACFIIQWIIIFSIKDNFGGYTLRDVLLLWGIASSTYGFAHLFFENAFHLSSIINEGKLDSYLVQPKNVLLSSITSNIKVSAIGDLIYGLIVLLIYGATIKQLLLFTIFTITGGLIIVSVMIILNSLSFWINKADLIADVGEQLIVQFATYPDTIFKGITRIILFYVLPIGIANYIPIWIIKSFNLNLFLLIVGITLLSIILANIIFNKGLKRYSGSNLMSARI